MNTTSMPYFPLLRAVTVPLLEPGTVPSLLTYKTMHAFGPMCILTITLRHPTEYIYISMLHNVTVLWWLIFDAVLHLQLLNTCSLCVQLLLPQGNTFLQRPNFL